MKLNALYRKLLLVCFLFVMQSSFSQNMVLNPGFEDVNLSELLCSTYNNESSFSAAINYWDYPTQGSSDIFHMSLANNCLSYPLSTNTIAIGQQQPHGGESMAGFLSYGLDLNATETYREYLQGELTQDLIVGNTYHINIYVSLADNLGVATNNIGFKFTTERQDITSSGDWETTPDVNYAGAPITDKENWTLLTYTFTPTEPNLRYFSIGNFFTNTETTVVNMSGSDYPDNSYYYVDDVFIGPAVDECSLNSPTTISPNQSFCASENATLNDVEVDGANLQWYTEATGGTPLDPVNFELITGTYYVSQTIDGCESERLAINVSINQEVVPFFDPVGTICGNQTLLSLPTTSVNGITGTWSPEIDMTQSGVYIFTPSSGACATETSMEITVLEPFDFEIDEACTDGDFVLEATPLQGSYHASTATVVWEMSGSEVHLGTLFNVSEYLGEGIADEELPVTVSATVTTTEGCSVSKSFTIENVYCNIQQGISPNGDGANDFFDLSLLEVDRLTIYNRYGTKIYDKVNYINEWYGQTDNGDNVPAGTFYYHITFKNGKKPKTGWIYVVR